jgi:hypothetical protein
MLKKEVTYEDFNGEQQTETLWFHVSKSEMIQLNFEENLGSLAAMVKAKKANEQDILRAFKKIVGLAYGVKSEDGRRFHKDPAQTADFLNSQAYDALFMDILTGDSGKAMEFLFGMFPADLAEAARNEVPKFDIPPSGVGSTQGIQVNSIKINETDPGAAQHDAVPDAFKRNVAAARASQKVASPSNPAPAQGPKPLNEMTEEELRAELTKVRGN